MYRLAAAGLVVTALAVISPVGFGHSEEPAVPAPLPTANIVQPPSGPSIRKQQPIPKPQIAAAAIARADKQVAMSEDLRAFLAGTPYKIKNEGYWTREGSSVPIGLVREITLAKPVTTSMRQWPVIVWRDDKNDYDQHSYNVQYKNVTSALLYLDNGKGLVSIAPGEGAAQVEGPGNLWTKSLPKGKGE